MLISDLRVIGNNLLAVRKKLGMTQMEVAEAAGLADRTYADIERGSVNMRLEPFCASVRRFISPRMKSSLSPRPPSPPVRKSCSPASTPAPKKTAPPPSSCWRYSSNP